jgi:hypothetical protein
MISTFARMEVKLVGNWIISVEKEVMLKEGSF